MSSKVDFLTQARLDDEEFVRALARGRSVRKEMNLAYSRIKRKTTASILTKDRPIKGDRTNIHTQQGTARYTPKPKVRNETNVKNQKTDLFVVTKVRMKAKRPSDTVMSPMRSGNAESVNLPRLNHMPTPVGSTRIYVDL